MVNLIRTHIFKFLTKEGSTEFVGSNPDVIVELSCDEYILTEFKRNILHEAEKSGFVIKQDDIDLAKTLRDYDTVIIPFLCTLKLKLNPNITGYTLTKIK